MGEIQIIGGLGAGHGEKVALQLELAKIRLSYCINRKKSFVLEIKAVGWASDLTGFSNGRARTLNVRLSVSM
jgi:hypothetical protein